MSETNDSKMIRVILRTLVDNWDIKLTIKKTDTAEQFVQKIAKEAQLPNGIYVRILCQSFINDLFLNTQETRKKTLQELRIYDLCDTVFKDAMPLNMIWAPNPFSKSAYIKIGDELLENANSVDEEPEFNQPKLDPDDRSQSSSGCMLI